MASGKTGPPVFNGFEIHPHLPVTEGDLFFNHIFLGRTVQIMAKTAIPALITLNMQPVKILLFIPKAGGPVRFLRIQDIGIMTQETEFKMLCGSRHIGFFGIGADQQGTYFRSVGLMADDASAIADGCMGLVLPAHKLLNLLVAGETKLLFGQFQQNGFGRTMYMMA